MKKLDLLFELCTEELPAKALPVLSQALAASFQAECQKLGLPHGEVQTFSTPRRLAILVLGLETMQAPQQIERKGPAVSAAFDAEGQPTKAALGFAKSVGVDISALERSQLEQGEFLVFRLTKPAVSTITLLPELLKTIVKQLPLEKTMRWHAGEHAFLRPVKSILALFGTSVIPLELFGLTAAHKTYGHRFHYPLSIPLRKPRTYAAKLHDAHVIADPRERQELILRQIQSLAHRKKAKAVVSLNLLEEVTGLVEWPVAMLAHFDQRFLKLPKEVLIISMETHQRYFPLEDGHGNLLPYFVFIANLDSLQPNAVMKGNQKVLRARLNDAAFFFDMDITRSLDDRREDLKTVLFQAELGTLFEKTERLQKLAAWIAKRLAAPVLESERVAALCLSDLTTAMVGEFPELQGVMGRVYALQSGESPEVAEALELRYQPKSSQDNVPENRLAQVVGIAERADLLIGILGIKQYPTGDKDPYALRRAALGILRVLLEQEISLNLPELLGYAAELYGSKLKNGKVVEEALEFIAERLKYRLLEEGYTADQFAAVMTKALQDPLDVLRRLNALREFLNTPESKFLIQANKRVKNILKQASGELLNVIDVTLLREVSETALFQQLSLVQGQCHRFLSEQQYGDAFRQLATLEKPLAAFFEQVMVMSEEEAVRMNRCTLLHQVRLAFLSITDLSLLNG